MAELVAQGGSRSLLEIGAYDNRFQEGQRGQLHITFRGAVPGAMLGSLEKALRLARVPLEGTPFLSGKTLVIRFRKANPILVPIAAVLGGIFIGLLLLMVVSWALFRENAPAFFGSLALLIGTVAALVYVQEGKRTRSGHGEG